MLWLVILYRAAKADVPQVAIVILAVKRVIGKHTYYLLVVGSHRSTGVPAAVALYMGISTT